jgi:hypothetical protein
MDKKITRKQFLFSIGTFLGMLLLSKVPFIGENKRNNTTSYGTNPYGGKSKNNVL